MKSVNHEKLETLIHATYDKKIPLFIWGATGIGKSTVVKKVSQGIAKKKGLEFSECDIEDGRFGFVDVRVSQLDASDLRGLPKLDGDRTRWLIPSWLPSNPKGSGIIFFDELNLAPPMIQASCYQLILDRKLGDYRLPDGWVVIAAGNRLEDRANIFEMASPLANRFIHIELSVPSSNDWMDWALKNDIDSKIISFLQFKPSMLFKFDNNSKEKAFPTPRSWEYVSKLIKDVDNENELSMLVSAAVGEGVALELCAFIKLSKQVDINEILKNPDTAEIPTEISLKYSLISALPEHYRKNDKLLEKIMRLCQRLEPEFAVLLLRMMKGVGKTKFIDHVSKLKEWDELSKKYAKFLI